MATAAPAPELRRIAVIGERRRHDTRPATTLLRRLLAPIVIQGARRGGAMVGIAPEGSV